MTYTTYILYSSSIDKFYIGYTGDDILERLKKHNSDHKGFTGKVHDWTIQYKEEYQSQNLATKREKQMKRWKSRLMLEQLISNSK